MEIEIVARANGSPRMSPTLNRAISPCLDLLYWFPFSRDGELIEYATMKMIGRPYLMS